VAAAGIAVYFLAVAGRTWRWHYLLKPLKEVTIRKLFPVVAIGYMGNNVYPDAPASSALVLKRNEQVASCFAGHIIVGKDV